MPGCKVTSSGLFTTITFRLSDFVRSKASRRSTAREDIVDEEKHMAASIYPSGNLAIIIFADNTEGVCIVLDDNGSSCPIRAFFQSSGIATCYHSNGRTWLHMDMWGGRTLNQDLSKRTRWKWTDYAKKPTPFKPLQMSLNKNIGVRVRARDSIVVTFLASGQQARFRVGSIIKPSEPAPSADTEDLMLQVCQLNARMALERLRWCLALNSRRRKFPPGLISQGRRLLRLSSDMYIEEKDKAYIQHCLRDCQ
ncbi:Glutamate-rich protein 6 [Bagarius yarrelli]|uniref:Glutamate-rich protein 6 n=1 Tax=Bagarius yarrelli TaxID=175774 RepID=A0A556V350_BAGYA|nr:Glutamate-rich protein 6 [Bagarius yarrelli]